MRFQYWIRLSGKQVPCTSSTRVSPPLADDIGFEIIDLHPLVQLSLGNPASPAAMLEEAASDASSLQYASETMRNEPETKCGRVFDTSKRCQILDRFFGSATQPTGMRIHSAAWGHDLIVHRHSHSSLRFYSDAILIHQFSWTFSLLLGIGIFQDVHGFPDFFIVQDWCFRVSSTAHRRAAAALCVANSSANSVGFTSMDSEDRWELWIPMDSIGPIGAPSIPCKRSSNGKPRSYISEVPTIRYMSYI